MNNMHVLKTSLPEDIGLLKAYGDFEKAALLIDKYLTRKIPKALAERLILEKDILKELPIQYPFAYDKALKIMQEKVEGFTEDDLDALKDDGYADWIYVNGVVHFQDLFVASIAKTCPKYKDIEVDADQKTIEVSPVEILDETVNEMIETGKKSYFIHLRHSIKIKKEAEEVGNKIRIYLPLPQNADQISQIKILNISPEPLKIADETYGQRTVCFEKPLESGDTFTVEFSYENHAKYVALDPQKVDNEQPDFETHEQQPHIAFNPYIRTLCAELTKGETNPLIKARKIYDFITTQIHYSYVREYLTIENIPNYAATGLKGDCGIQALLFITLCRCAGIPAKWQSGAYVNPVTIGNHDWAMFYIAPYGWLHCDCSFGGSAYRSGAQNRWNFYFGNLEPFRMSANSEFQLDFDPPKTYLRSDPYDNQRGECEYANRRLTFHDFDEKREIIEIYPID